MTVRTHRTGHSILTAAIAFICLLAPTVMSGATLAKSNIVTSSNARHSRVEIRLDQEVDIRVVDQVADADPRYFFIDLYGTRPSFDDKFIPISDGILRGMQFVAYPETSVLRVIFLPENDTSFRVADRSTGFVYPISQLDATELPRQRTRTRHLIVDTPKLRRFPFPRLHPGGDMPARESNKTGIKRLVVLDPGHGQGDPGALSTRKFSGRRLEERDIVLAIAREACRLLNKTPNVAAALTRNSNQEKISLERRVDFSEKMDADLFVSIHANSTKYHNSKTARGVEFYYFSSESKNETQALVEAENKAFSPELGEGGNAAWRQIAPEIVRDLIDRNRAEGAEVCAHLSDAFTRDPYYENRNRGVKSAPFLVLMNVVSPSVLVEVGFIDNPQEAAQLAQPAFQKRIARLLVDGIMRHFAQLDSEFVYYRFAE